MNLKNPKPATKAIVVTFKVSATEMREIMARAHAYTKGNMSRWIRYAAMNHKPKKEDLEK